MSIYKRNRSCSCQRCRTHGLMGAAILITLGILFLLQNYGVVSWDQDWPALLIVIGLCLFATHHASMEGHLPFAGSAPQRMDQEVKP